MRNFLLQLLLISSRHLCRKAKKSRETCETKLAKLKLRIIHQSLAHLLEQARHWKTGQPNPCKSGHEQSINKACETVADQVESRRFALPWKKVECGSGWHLSVQRVKPFTDKLIYKPFFTPAFISLINIYKPFFYSFFTAFMSGDCYQTTGVSLSSHGLLFFFDSTCTS